MPTAQPLPRPPDVLAMSSSCLCISPVVNPRCGRTVTSGLWLSSGNKLLLLQKKAPRCGGVVVAVLPEGSKEKSRSAWDDEPFEFLPGGKIAYLDEQDIVSILEPPKELIPLDSATYNPAAYVWKKIGDIPEERRHHLLYLLKPRLVSRLWALVGARYQDAKLMKKVSSALNFMEDTQASQEIWNCRKTSGPFPISWINDFKKVIFRGKDGVIYGRFFLGDSFIASAANSFSPLYFTVKEVNEVMPTEQPCDLAYELGNGLLDPINLPEGFPSPVRHRQPFNDQLVVYVRNVGPGVVVGQAWREGRELEQVPKKFCGEILMVKDYGPSHKGP